MILVKPLLREHLPIAVTLLETVVAAEMDAVFRFFLPDENDRRMFHRTLLTSALTEEIAHGNVYGAYHGDQVVGASTWQFAHRPSFKQRIRSRARDILRTGPPTIWQAFELADRHRTIWPHWYLMFMGVDPNWRNAGLGQQLLAPLLQRADETQSVIYLTTMLRRNHRFYKRLGFVIAGDWSIDRSPVMWIMQREAQPTQN